MREGTLILFYLVKFAELIAVVTWTTMMIISGLNFILSLRFSGNELLFILSVVSMVLAVYHVLYINLLINMRFKCKMNCFTIGKCVFDAFNFVCCYACLRDVCRDRCFKWPTLGKWVVKGGLFGYLYFAVRSIK